MTFCPGWKYLGLQAFTNQVKVSIIKIISLLRAFYTFYYLITEYFTLFFCILPSLSFVRLPLQLRPRWFRANSKNGTNIAAPRFTNWSMRAFSRVHQKRNWAALTPNHCADFADCVQWKRWKLNRRPQWHSIRWVSDRWSGDVFNMVLFYCTMSDEHLYCIVFSSTIKGNLIDFLWMISSNKIETFFQLFLWLFGHFRSGHFAQNWRHRPTHCLHYVQHAHRNFEFERGHFDCKSFGKSKDSEMDEYGSP